MKPKHQMIGIWFMDVYGLRVAAVNRGMHRPCLTKWPFWGKDFQEFPEGDAIVVSSGAAREFRRFSFNGGGHESGGRVKDK